MTREDWFQRAEGGQRLGSGVQEGNDTIFGIDISSGPNLGFPMVSETQCR